VRALEHSVMGAAEGSGAARYGEGQEKSLLYNCLKGGCSKESVRLLPRVMRGNGLKLCQGRLKLGTIKNFFMERVVKNGMGFPGTRRVPLPRGV